MTDLAVRLEPSVPQRSRRPANYVPEYEAPCLLCESTAGERERVGNWVWCLDAIPCRTRREHLPKRRHTP